MHSERPDIYKDSNHKPEILIALSPFVGLCGFRPYTEINKYIMHLKPLRQLLTGDCINTYEKFYSTDVLRKYFGTLMTAKETEITKIVTQIKEDYGKGIIYP